MIEKIKLELNDLLSTHFKHNVIIEEPKNVQMGDVSIVLFELSKKLNKTFLDCHDEIIEIIKNSNLKPFITSSKLIGGFLNLSIDKKKVSDYVMREIQSKDKDYGTSPIGKDKRVVIDYSSPNIAKPFSIGHLRSTIIGHSIGKILEKANYQVIRINHLGDWGTQFGKVIVAYKKWGSKELVEKNPIEELLKLYVSFTERASNDESLTIEAREVFKELENGNTEYLKLWEWFKEESLKELKVMYDLLDVEFDYYQGEAFYQDKMAEVVIELENKNLLKEDNGAYIVELDDLIPALIKKSDGSTLYITRDLAAVFYRLKTYQFDKALYVIGGEQTLHFKQLKAVLNKMGYQYDEKLEHISFGLVMQNGKKMSTRKGRIVKLMDVLDEAIDKAYQTIEKKNPDLPNKKEIAKNVGVSAVIFNDLKNYRENDVEFNLEQMLQFEGETGPYLQFTSVRIHSVLKNIDINDDMNLDLDFLQKDYIFEIIRLLDKYQTIIEKAATTYEPSVVAKYALDLAKQFNKFYGLDRILVDDLMEKNTKLILSYHVKLVLDECMTLLGMKIIEQM